MKTIDRLRALPWQPRFNGNGFAQLKVAEDARLHFWTPQLPVLVHNAQVHDHRYDAYSQVLYGELVHDVWNAWLMSATGYYQINRVGGSDPKTENTPKPVLGMDGAPQRWDAKVVGSYRMAAGSSYVFPHPQLHSSHASMAVTLFRQVNDWKDYRPRILSLWGETPQHAYDLATAPSEAQLWEAIELLVNFCPDEIAQAVTTLSLRAH